MKVRGMGALGKKPISFKIDSKSSLASKLKLRISRKLPLFFQNYSDDVLAEYIAVLVCNGKNQNQARDDLEAFLGERSAEFVTWLWDLLVKYAPQSNVTIGVLDRKDVTVTDTNDSDTEKDSGIKKLSELQNHGTRNADSSLIKDENHLLTFHSNKMEIPKGDQHCARSAPVNDLNTKSETCGRAIPTEIGVSRNVQDDSLTHESPRMGGPSKIPAGKDGVQCADKKKIANIRCGGLPDQLSYFSKRDTVSRNIPSSVSENSHPRQLYASNASGRRSVSPGAVGAASHQDNKPRGSVWDRLGKPCEVTFVRSQSVDASGVGIVGQDEETLGQSTVSLPFPNDKLEKSVTRGASRLGKRVGSSDCTSEYRKSEHDVNTMHELHAANNIRHKRHFGDISTSTGTDLVSLVNEKNIGIHSTEYLQSFKRATFTTQDSDMTAKNQGSGCPLLAAKPESINSDQVLDVKLRLRQIEKEMSKLRSKQEEIEKDGKSNLLSSTGALKHADEDVESRTVFVTNVHFAATKEALSLYFAQCGVVINVVILTDKVTFQRPKGSAYITFISKESVDKAVELSGTTFYSRTIKVLRKTEVADMTSAPCQLAIKPSQLQSPLNRKAVLGRPYYSISHLQWRRESVSASSTPTSTCDGGITSSASMRLQVDSYQCEESKGASSSMGNPADGKFLC